MRTIEQALTAPFPFQDGLYVATLYPGSPIPHREQRIAHDSLRTLDIHPNLDNPSTEYTLNPYPNGTYDARLSVGSRVSLETPIGNRSFITTTWDPHGDQITVVGKNLHIRTTQEEAGLPHTANFFTNFTWEKQGSLCTVRGEYTHEIIGSATEEGQAVHSTTNPFIAYIGMETTSVLSSADLYLLIGEHADAIRISVIMRNAYKTNFHLDVPTTNPLELSLYEALRVNPHAGDLSQLAHALENTRASITHDNRQE